MLGGGVRVNVNEDLKKFGSGDVGGIRADVNEELKLFWKCKRKYRGWGRSGPAGDGVQDGGWSIGRGLVGSNVWG